MTWTPGDVSGSQTLTDNDHLYAVHINELRNNADATNSTIVALAGTIFKTFTAIVDINGDGQYTDIQTAIDAVEANGGGTVFIREGTYTISTAITLCNNLAILGEGSGTILKLANSTDSHIINNDLSVIENFYIGSLSIDGNSANQTSTTSVGIRGIFKNAIFENLYIHDTCAQAIGFVGGSSCRDFLIRGIIVSFTNPKATAEGIFVRGERGLITNCSVFNPGDSGIILEEAEAGVPSNYLSVTNCSLGSCANYGIVYSQTAAGGKGISICNNVVSGSTNEGIILGMGSDGVISGNSIYGCVQGINLINQSKHCLVSNNVVSNNTQNGILIQGTTSELTISSNVCHNNAGSGIKVFENSGTISISNNMIYSNASSGINLGSASSEFSISGNIIHDNDTGNLGANGIDVGGGTNIVISGNRLFNSGTTGQDYAIRSFNNSDYLLVVANNTRNNSIGTINLVGSNNLIANNI